MRVFLALAIVCFASGALAGERPQVLITSEDNGAVPAAFTAPDSFTYHEEIGSGIESIAIEHAAGSAEHRFTTQAAIGQDGPWVDLEGITARSSWQPVPLTSDGILCGSGSAQPCHPATHAVLHIATSQAAVDKAAAEADRRDNDAGRWSNLAARCVAEDGSIDDTKGPCYLYRAQDEYRFTGTDGQRYRLTISHPGGC